MIRKKGVTWLLCLGSIYYYAEGQELEPRAYAAFPKNLNTIAVGCGFSSANVLTDPSLPVSNFKISLQSLTGVHQEPVFSMQGYAPGDLFDNGALELPGRFRSQRDKL